MAFAGDNEGFSPLRPGKCHACCGFGVKCSWERWGDEKACGDSLNPLSFNTEERVTGTFPH